MKLKLLTCAWDYNTGEFNTDALDDFQERYSIIQFQAEVVTIDHVPVWSILVAGKPYSPAVEPTTASRGKTRPDTPVLNTDDHALYRRLCDWRNDTARLGGFPPYLIFTNAQAAVFAQKRPQTLTELQSISHFGEKRSVQYGSAILEILGLPFDSSTDAPPDASVEVPVDG